MNEQLIRLEMRIAALEARIALLEARVFAHEAEPWVLPPVFTIRTDGTA